jgi:hypothetical protein
MIQGVVKPKVTDSVYGKCHINLSTEDKEVIENQKTVADDEVVEETVAKAPVSTEVDDSDAEQDEPAVPTPAPSPAPAKKVVVKKAPVAEPVAEPVVEAKKVVVKKKVVAGK